ncbi:fungal-specific transcription factor domain-containing protein [Aspergillus filifer]
MGKQQAKNRQPATPAKSKPRLTRSRIACDWCHSNHARCDREFPCGRCLKNGTQCEFTRVRRKRGRIPKSDNIEGNTPEVIKTSPSTLASSPEAQSTCPSEGQNIQTPQVPHDNLYPAGLTIVSPDTEELPFLESNGWLTEGIEVKVTTTDHSPLAQSALSQILDDVSFRDGFDGNSFPAELFSDALSVEHEVSAGSGVESASTSLSKGDASDLRYPVLRPLMPFMKPKLSPELACDLLDLYFTSAYTTSMHPVCRHIHCYVLRKASFLNERHYRACSPALLASMLWAASLSDHTLSLPLTVQHRKEITGFLGSLAIQLLHPSTYAPYNIQCARGPSGAAFSAASPGTLPDAETEYFTSSSGVKSPVCPPGSLDDIITLMHIASISSANGQSALSMNWWHAAFTLARELKLNQEVHILPSMNSGDICMPYLESFPFSASTSKVLDCVCGRSYGSTVPITEEQREERRRTWWLLYIIDRHLALCYNRPLMLLDSDSIHLLLPLDDEAWQAGKIHSNSPDVDGPHCIMSGSQNMRRGFPDFTCGGPSIFGFFLPLMTIMGQILDVNQIINHPMLLPETFGDEAWMVQLHQVLGQLDTYEASLYSFITNASTPGPSSFQKSSQYAALRPQLQANLWLIQTIASYASYYIDVLHILQSGKWDPISLMDDRGFWSSSLDLALAIPHALKAADSVRQILKFDPDVSFMPDFFGIQLLQGSFYFLLILQQLQNQAGETFLDACEVMIRANESCVVTSGSGYQKSLCQVMRSILAQVRGRPMSDCDIRQRQRAIMALSRWTKTGSALVS